MSRARPGRVQLLVALALLIGAAVHAGAAPAQSPAGIAPARGTRVVSRIHEGLVETVIADSLNSPVSMAVAPDGRVFVCEQGGRLRVIRGGALLAKPFLIAPTVPDIEEGLLSVAFDPRFASNHFVYVCYTVAPPHRHSRIVRVIASGDTALAGSATTLFDLDDDNAHHHVGGALHFGRDGKLYTSTGDNGDDALSQSLGSTFGKLLRINPDGSIPGDNPFLRLTSGHHRAIWARGFANAFTFDVEPRTGRIFIDDVGGSNYEEINEGVAGANYGWPLYAGPGANPKFRFPVYSYDHSAGCAITGGAFYDPPAAILPREWIGRYLFADYCRSEIRWIDPASPAHHGVLGPTLILGPVDLRVGPDGSVYYLVRGTINPVGGNNTSSGMVVRVTGAVR